MREQKPGVSTVHMHVVCCAPSALQQPDLRVHNARRFVCVRVTLMRECLAAYMYLYAPDVAVPGSVGGSAFSFADVNSLLQKKKK